jgi:hypothetical protein
MARWRTIRDAVAVAVTSWRLWLVQFVGNAVIALAFVGWLRLPDAHWWQLLFGFLLIIACAAAALVLHVGTLDYCRSAHQTKAAALGPAFRRASRHLPAIVLWALVLLFLECLVAKLDSYSVSFPGYLRSEFPAWLRRIISEPRLDSLFTGSTWVLRWVILPGLLLPFAAFCAERGFRGLISFRDWRRALGGLIYWIVLLVAALIGVCSTQALMGWTLDPKTATLSAEETSLFFRLLAAYLLEIFSWLLACSVLGRTLARGSGETGAKPA